MHTRHKHRHGNHSVPMGKPIVPLRWRPLQWLAVVALAFALVALAPAINDEIGGLMPAELIGSATPDANPNWAASYAPIVPLTNLATGKHKTPQAGVRPESKQPTTHQNH
ncbi:MAG: hypothetical protein ABI135_10290 [Rhodoferax sp.]